MRDHDREKQSIDFLQVSAEDILQLLSQFDLYGYWRVDLDSGLAYWSDDVYKIHGLEKTGPSVDLLAAINAYHPEDRPYLTQLMEEAVEKKSGFRFVLRLKRPYGGYKLVKSNGRYRENQDGRPELFGTFSEFQPAKRAIASSAA